MKTLKTSTIYLALLLSVGVVSAVHADTKKGAGVTDSQNLSTQSIAREVKENKSKRQITYRPPLRGAPTRRIGGSSRAPGIPSVQILVFAAEHTGLTMFSQPSLYWYLSKQINRSVEVTLTNSSSIEPVLRTVVTGPIAAGVHKLPLKERGIRLRPNVEYEWSVAIVFDPKRRSRDVVSSATIRHVELSGMAVDRINRSSDAMLPAAYADEGLWYDAMAAISQMIEVKSTDSKLKEKRAALLSQVGLSEFIPLIDRN